MTRCKICKKLFPDPKPSEETSIDGNKCPNPLCVPSYNQEPYETPTQE